MLYVIFRSLKSGVPTTIRDVYYADVTLFNRSQATASRLVDRLMRLLGDEGEAIPRAALGIVASPKGMFSGALDVVLSAGAQASATATSPATIPGKDGVATLIPDDSFVEALEPTRALQWVLIVEKEAVFQTLCVQRITDGVIALQTGRELRPGLLIAGKGYPDLATKQFIALLHRSRPR